MKRKAIVMKYSEIVMLLLTRTTFYYNMIEVNTANDELIYEI